MHLLVGTYPVDGPAGSGEGIWQVGLDTRSGRLSTPVLLVATPSPSFLALHPSGRTLLAVSEQTDGAVHAFAVAPSGLEPVGSASSGGADPCHVLALDDRVLVSNYSSGTFTVLPVDVDGRLTDEPAATFGHEGTGPDEGRQEGPHAHSALLSPDGASAWVVDLGTDEIRGYGLMGTTTATRAGIAATLPAGAGPRHAVVHPDGTVLVAGELDSRVHVLRADAAADVAVPVAALSACTTPAPAGVGSFPSHIALSADGSRLYVGVRGPDVVSTFAVLPGESGVRLEHLADTHVGGVWPRHFAVVDGGSADASADTGADLVVVANQGSSDVVVLRVDRATGTGEVVDSAVVGAPACILPLP